MRDSCSSSPAGSLRVAQLKKLKRYGRAGVNTMLPPAEVLVLLDADGRIVRAIGRHMGTRLSELVFLPGRSIHDVLHPYCVGTGCELASLWEAAWQQHGDGLPVEWELISHFAGGVFKLRLQPVSYAGGPLFEPALNAYMDHSVLIIQDISAVYGRRRGDMPRTEIGRRVRQSEGETGHDGDDSGLAASGLSLTISRDTERNRIAAELHDGLGQIFSLLRFELEAYMERPERTDRRRTDPALERMHQYVLDSLAELRHVTRDLRPTTLDELGLRGSLDLLVSETATALPEISIEADIAISEDNLPGLLVLAIYRICQEGLNNIVRHSEATEAGLRISGSSEGIEIEISDNGTGLPLDTGAETIDLVASADSSEPLPERMLKHGYGISSMRQRIEGTGGRFRLSSSPGKGCTVSARWPVEAIRLLR